MATLGPVRLSTAELHVEEKEQEYFQSRTCKIELDSHATKAIQHH